MRRLVGLFVIVLLVIGSYIFFINRPRNYSVQYDVDKYTIIEKFDKDLKKYSFTINYEDIEYYFVFKSKYSNKRKLVEDIKVKSSDDTTCIKPIVSKMKFDYICFDGDYKVIYLTDMYKSKKVKKINTYKNINIYNKDYSYYIWNGYGLTNIVTEKEHNFLDNEQYDNSLAYKYGNYIIFANYNQKRTFNSFYVFDYKKEKLFEWEIDLDIDFDSYFMGDVEGYIYLFDRKNSIQYKIDVIEQDITISSDKEGALYYEHEWISKPLNEFKYKDYFMEDDNLYEFLLNNNKLYLNIDNRKQNIAISNHKIVDVINENDDSVFYLVEDDIYVYKINKGEQKLLDYFEWNFSYKNKIYIFN